MGVGWSKLQLSAWQQSPMPCQINFFRFAKQLKTLNGYIKGSRLKNLLSVILLSVKVSERLHLSLMFHMPWWIQWIKIWILWSCPSPSGLALLIWNGPIESAVYLQRRYIAFLGLFIQKLPLQNLCVASLSELLTMSLQLPSGSLWGRVQAVGLADAGCGGQTEGMWCPAVAVAERKGIGFPCVLGGGKSGFFSHTQLALINFSQKAGTLLWG